MYCCLLCVCVCVSMTTHFHFKIELTTRHFTARSSLSSILCPLSSPLIPICSCHPFEVHEPECEVNSFVCSLIGGFFFFLFPITHTVMVTILVTYPCALKLICSLQSVLRVGCWPFGLCLPHLDMVTLCSS